MRKPLFSVTIKDCDVQYFCTGGNGGQNQNAKRKGVRITHRASGSVGEGREYREQIQNKRAAFVRMANTAKFKLWHAYEVHSRLGLLVSLTGLVDDAMRPTNLKFETMGPEGWKPE